MYIPPDYSEAMAAESEHPRDDEDDALEEMLEENEDDIKAEQYLDEQAALNEGFMSFSTPGWSSSPWSTGGDSGSMNNNSVPPWQQQNNNNGNSGNSGSGSPWSKPSFGWGSSASTQQKQPEIPVIGHKDIIFVNMVDGIVESLTSSGKPGILPRASYDIRLKFEVWDRIRAFSPRMICVFSENIPGFGDKADIVNNFVIASLSDYLGLPTYCCKIVTLKKNGKAEAISKFMSKVPMVSPGQVFFVGTYCGDWGLSTEDTDAARKNNIECASFFHLLGKI